MTTDASDTVNQRTLTGDELEVDAVECDVYPICSRAARYEVETLLYDGTGWYGGTVVACERCAREFTEPEHPDEAEKARELRREERLKP